MKITMTVELESDELIELLNLGSRPEDVLKEMLLRKLQFGLAFREWQPMDLEVKIK